MPRNGSGNYSPPSNSFNPAVADTPIDPEDWNAVLGDLADALTGSLAADGQTPATARIPFAVGIEVPAGSETAPGITFDNDTSANTGIFSPAVGEFGITAGGDVVLHTDGDELHTDMELHPDGGIVLAGGTISHVLLSTGTHSSAVNLDIELPTGFRRFVVYVRDLSVAVSSPMHALLSFDGGGSFPGNGYGCAVQTFDREGTGGNQNLGGVSAYFPVTGHQGLVTGSDQPTVIDLTIDTPTSGSRRTQLTADATFLAGAGANPCVGTICRGYSGANGRATDIRLYLNSGGSWSGTYALYGVLN